MKRYSIRVLALMAVLAIAGVAHGDVGDRGHGGGHDVPTPLLSDANQRVELADGEIYQILGMVVFDEDGAPYMRVDLRKMPWLATAARKAFPLYRLEGTADFWRPYSDQRIKFTCEAHGNVNDGRYEITLGPIGGTRYKIERQ